MKLQGKLTYYKNSQQNHGCFQADIVATIQDLCLLLIFRRHRSFRKNTNFLWAVNCRELHFPFFTTGIGNQFIYATSLKVQWQWRKQSSGEEALTFYCWWEQVWSKEASISATPICAQFALQHVKSVQKALTGIWELWVRIRLQTVGVYVRVRGLSSPYSM